MTTLIILFALVTMAALAPWFGSDSRRLSAQARTDYFPALPLSR